MMALEDGTCYECELGMGRIGGIFEFIRQSPCSFSHISQPCGRQEYTCACLFELHIPAYHMVAFLYLTYILTGLFIIYIVNT